MYFTNLFTCCIPNCFIKFRLKTNNNLKIKLYKEKLAIIIFIFILYSLITIYALYFSWYYCTNIIDIINNNIDNYNYNNNGLLSKNTDFCYIYDIILIIYIIILIFTLFLNIIIGIITDYYHKYKLYKYKKNININDEKIIINIPLYNEDYETIKLTIDSIINCNYTKEQLKLFIVVDGIIFPKNSNNSTDYILLHDLFQNDSYNNNNNTYQYLDNTLSIYNGYYKNVEYNVIVKDKNKGKRDSQLLFYQFINYINNNCEKNELFDKLYNNISNINEFNYMLIIDCDTEIEKNSLRLLLQYLQNHKQCISVCGQTVVKNANINIITYIQVYEYWISHLLLKNFESFMYNTLVMSGCFSLIRLKYDNKLIVNNNIIQKFSEVPTNLHTSNLIHIGEDRYLTSLMLQEHPNNTIKYLSNAYCSTNVPESLSILLCQRRRWTNSLIHCLFLLFKNPPNINNKFKKFKLYYIILLELMIIFILPIIIVIGLINTIISMTVQGFSYISFIITMIVLLLNLIIAILSFNINKIPYFIPFLLTLPIFSIYIPLYSIFNMDNIKWGKTREINEHIEIISNNLPRDNINNMINLLNSTNQQYHSITSP